jgi:hypothetical protein
MKLCIGLFGTCGGSKWRAPFMSRYTELGLTHYNPQVEDWNPECAVEEAAHLAQDMVILFPVTSETYATGSLAEVGFSILQAINLDDRREFVIMIEQHLDDSLDDALMRKESLRARALVLEHLKKLRLSNVYFVDTLEQMLEVSLQLYETAKTRFTLRDWNPHRRFPED